MNTRRILALLAALSFTAQAATPEQEKAFVESYKKALESADTKTLAAFLHTEGATAETVEFFTMMQAMDGGKKIASIELVVPTAEERAKYDKPMSMPDGRTYKMPFPPLKQLVIVIEEKTSERVGKSTSKIAVGEKDGKLVILVPVPAK